MPNNLLSFQNPCILETGLSDFHKMTVSIMKTTFTKDFTRDYKYFLMINLDWVFWFNVQLKRLVQIIMVYINFFSCADVLDNFAPLRGESHIDLCTQCVMMTVAGERAVGVGRLSVMTFWNSEMYRICKLMYCN